ncbi:MAG: septum formation initiator family protein [Clostridia bacterium]|nr:septum formation initiator family protein [Clostridia bacterium]
MAVKEFRPAKSRFKIKYKKTYLVLLILFMFVSVFCVGIRINNDAAIADYERQIAEVQEKVDKLSGENDEYTAVLTSTDRSAYYEKIAREVYGYAKPGEYVFYKTVS